MMHRLLPWLAFAVALALGVMLVWEAKAYGQGQGPPSSRVQRWLPDVVRHVQTIWQTKCYAALHGALIERESAGRPDVSSHAGAAGLVQIMPGTLAELRQQYPGFGSDPRNPQTSMALGFRYLHRMWIANKSVTGCERWKRSLSSYNAGYGGTHRRIRRHGADWLRHMPAETRHYVPTIIGRVPVFIRHGWPGVPVCAI